MFILFCCLLFKNISGIPPECQTVWIQVKPNILLDLILVPNCLQRLLPAADTRLIQEYFIKIIYPKYSFRNTVCYQSVKQFGSRAGQTIVSVLTWVQTVCKGYQQGAKVTVSKERVK